MLTIDILQGFFVDLAYADRLRIILAPVNVIEPINGEENPKPWPSNDDNLATLVDRIWVPASLAEYDEGEWFCMLFRLLI
jgi:hypothetical protein